MEEVARAVSGLGLPEKTLENLKTAVAEAALNAMEHGNHYRVELPVLIEVSASEAEISIKITDEGTGAYLSLPIEKPYPHLLTAVVTSRFSAHSGDLR
jgi:anti-sigma regulatory factor (Ser/Thr protein kinase)